MEWIKYHEAEKVFDLRTEHSTYQMQVREYDTLVHLYYGCPVVARRAPGPEYILTSGQDGFLCDNSMQISEYVEKLCNTPEYREEIVQNAHRRIMQDFTWKSTAEIMLKTMEAKQKENKSEP